jgi:hypothetical protein
LHFWPGFFFQCYNAQFHFLQSWVLVLGALIVAGEGEGSTRTRTGTITRTRTIEEVG